MMNLVRDLNRVYRSEPALYETDCFGAGFSWIDCHDSDNSIISYLRFAKDPTDFLVIVCNFTPVPREDYHLGVPRLGAYAEILNSDAEFYSGNGFGNAGQVTADMDGSHGQPHSLRLKVPPLGTLVLKPLPEEKAEDSAADETTTEDAAPPAGEAEATSDGGSTEA